jgi:hypothetical protein
MATNKKPIPRYAAQIDSLTNFDYDAFAPGLSWLPRLSPTQCKALLEELVEPNLREMRAWSKQLAEIRKTLEAGLDAVKKKRRLTAPEIARAREIETSLRQIHDGLSHGGIQEGVSPNDFALLKPLIGLPGQEAMPGQEETNAIIAKLERDREYLVAYLKRWPTPEEKHGYICAMNKRVKPLDIDGREITRGMRVDLTETQVRAVGDLFEAVDQDPALQTYVEALTMYRY